METRYSETAADAVRGRYGNAWAGGRQSGASPPNEEHVTYTTVPFRASYVIEYVADAFDMPALCILMLQHTYTGLKTAQHKQWQRHVLPTSVSPHAALHCPPQLPVAHERRSSENSPDWSL